MGRACPVEQIHRLFGYSLLLPQDHGPDDRSFGGRCGLQDRLPQKTAKILQRGPERVPPVAAEDHQACGVVDETPYQNSPEPEMSFVIEPSGVSETLGKSESGLDPDLVAVTKNTRSPHADQQTARSGGIDPFPEHPGDRQHRSRSIMHDFRVIAYHPFNIYFIRTDVMDDVVPAPVGVKIPVHRQYAREKKGEKQTGVKDPPLPFHPCKEDQQNESEAGLNRRVGYRQEAAAGDSRHQGQQRENDRPGHPNHRYSCVRDQTQRSMSNV